MTSQAVVPPSLSRGNVGDLLRADKLKCELHLMYDNLERKKWVRLFMVTDVYFGAWLFLDCKSDDFYCILILVILESGLFIFPANT